MPVQGRGRRKGYDVSLGMLDVLTSASRWYLSSTRALQPILKLRSSVGAFYRQQTLFPNLFKVQMKSVFVHPVMTREQKVSVASTASRERTSSFPPFPHRTAMLYRKLRIHKYNIFVTISCNAFSSVSFLSWVCRLIHSAALEATHAVGGVLFVWKMESLPC